MSKYLTVIITIVTGIAAAFAPQLQAFIVGHPAVAAGLAAVGTLIAHYIPSPLEK